MKVVKQTLEQIIKEEIKKVLSEAPVAARRQEPKKQPKGAALVRGRATAKQLRDKCRKKVEAEKAASLDRALDCNTRYAKKKPSCVDDCVKAEEAKAHERAKKGK
jgi:hypothetical protein